MDSKSHRYERMDDRAIKRWLNKFNHPHDVYDLFILQRADIKATGYDLPELMQELDTIKERVKKILSEKPPMSVSDLVINGHDLMKEGYEPGPIFSLILSELLEEIIDNPERNDKEYLMKRASEIHDRSMGTEQEGKEEDS